jgi:hypothetical protein
MSTLYIHCFIFVRITRSDLVDNRALGHLRDSSRHSDYSKIARSVNNIVNSEFHEPCHVICLIRLYPHGVTPYKAYHVIWLMEFGIYNVVY